MNELKHIANEHFRKAVNTWKNECPNETTGICEDEFDERGLLFKTLTTTDAPEPDLFWGNDASAALKYS